MRSKKALEVPGMLRKEDGISQVYLVGLEVCCSERPEQVPEGGILEQFLGFKRVQRRQAIELNNLQCSLFKLGWESRCIYRQYPIDSSAASLQLLQFYYSRLLHTLPICKLYMQNANLM